MDGSYVNIDAKHETSIEMNDSAGVIYASEHGAVSIEDSSIVSIVWLVEHFIYRRVGVTMQPA